MLCGPGERGKKHSVNPAGQDGLLCGGSYQQGTGWGDPCGHLPGDVPKGSSRTGLQLRSCCFICPIFHIVPVALTLRGQKLQLHITASLQNAAGSIAAKREQTAGRVNVQPGSTRRAESQPGSVAASKLAGAGRTLLGSGTEDLDDSRHLWCVPVQWLPQ